jgi:hypothetical protein
MNFYDTRYLLWEQNSGIALKCPIIDRTMLQVYGQLQGQVNRQIYFSVFNEERIAIILRTKNELQSNKS